MEFSVSKWGYSPELQSQLEGAADTMTKLSGPNSSPCVSTSTTPKRTPKKLILHRQSSKKPAASSQNSQKPRKSISTDCDRKTQLLESICKRSRAVVTDTDTNAKHTKLAQCCQGADSKTPSTAECEGKESLGSDGVGGDGVAQVCGVCLCPSLLIGLDHICLSVCCSRVSQQPILMTTRKNVCRL